MSRPNLFAAGVAAVAIAAAALFAASQRAEKLAALGDLAEARAANRALEDRLRGLEAATSRKGAEPAVDCPAPEECPAAREVVITPEGRRLVTPAEREAYTRAHLERRLTRAFREGVLTDDQRLGALELLMRIRELRVSGGSERELLDAQQELIELTGMGVGELLEEIEMSAAGSQRPDSAPPVAEGELRKRFADETARQLGIAKPRSVERYVDGDWQPEP